MKKIIALILVVAALALTLVSCGYKIYEDDVTKYASFDKTAFLEGLKSLVISDGDFTTDETKRADKVTAYYMDKIYTAAAKGDKLYSGEVGANDIVYYAYYITAEVDGVLYTFETKNMVEKNAVKVTVNKVDNDDLAKKIADALKGVDLKDKVYTTDIESKEDDQTIKAGDIIFVSGKVSSTEMRRPTSSSEIKSKEYTISESDFTSAFIGKTTKGAPATFVYDEGSEEGKRGEVTYSGISITSSDKKDDEALAVGDKITLSGKETYYTSETPEKTTRNDTLTYAMYVVSESDEFTKNFIGKKLDTTLDTFSVGEDDEENGVYNKKSYSSIKADFRVTAPFVTETTTDEDGKEVTTVKEPKELIEIIVKDTTYTSTKEFADAYGLKNGTVELKDVELTYHIFPVYRYAVDDSVESIIRYAIGSGIKSDLLDVFHKDDLKNGEGKTIAELVDALPELFTAYSNADKAVTDATSSEKEEKEKARDEAEKKLTDAIKEIVDLAGADTIKEEYRKYAYETLEKEYNNEIKDNLSAAVWKLAKDNFKVTSYPEKLVDECFKALYEQEEYTFHTGNYTSSSSSSSSDSTKESNFKHYGGSFDAYLMASTGTKTVAEAEEKLRADARAKVEPLLLLYLMADAYELRVTNEQFKEYTKDKKALAEHILHQEIDEDTNIDNLYDYKDYVNGVSYYGYQIIPAYGETNIRNAYQADILFDEILDRTETDGKVTYKNLTYTIKEA